MKRLLSALLLIALLVLPLCCGPKDSPPATDGNPPDGGPGSGGTTGGTGDVVVYVLDVGQGDAILIDQGEVEVLIDGSTVAQGDVVVTDLRPLVQGALDAVVCTHCDADHCGGLTKVLNSYTVTQLWWNGQTSDSSSFKLFHDAIDKARVSGTNVQIARRGGSITAGGDLFFNILNPSDITGTSNNNSVVLSLLYKTTTLLFEGDAEQEAEASMLKANIVPTDVAFLKVGHHGSKTSSGGTFLTKTKPKIAVYSCKTGNSYGHPAPTTIAALKAAGAAVYGTDANGTVTVTSDGTVCKVAVQKGNVL